MLLFCPSFVIKVHYQERNSFFQFLGSYWKLNLTYFDFIYTIFRLKRRVLNILFDGFRYSFGILKLNVLSGFFYLIYKYFLQDCLIGLLEYGIE